jgi:polyribonucleotide nucleotidyltransferase
MSYQTVSMDFDGKTYSIETGKMAKFANGSVLVRCGDTMVLVTAVANKDPLEGTDFMPLQVEYREKAFAAGKFPGGFLKREGRPSDQEILCSRLIDRPIRPLFPNSWRYETQILATVLSYDGETDPETLGAVGTSAALMISDIPFAGPISEVRVSRINGELIVNAPHKLLKETDLDITVAGSDTSIVMVEGESNEISEDEFLQALEFAHEKIKQLNNLQRELFSTFTTEKRKVEEIPVPEAIMNYVHELIDKDIDEYIHKATTKKERSAIRHELKDKVKEKIAEKFGELEEYKDKPLSQYAADAMEELEKEKMRAMIIKEGKRLDGRSLTDIRNITCEIGLLPRTHGSALFTRGETQSITTVTLGTKRDEQLIDGLQPQFTETFILQYNFPPFSTGEVKRMGTGRREIGHGNLAWRALKGMVPNKESFPYAIRVVSDILESNGSSSMATVCAGSLALYDGGVPMKKPVAGIAMGLIKEGDDIAILSDILGDEDHLGDMDFKVTGTADGITACQMDIKIEGLSLDIMRKALDQARAGRLHILSKMNECINEPREDLSAYAPRFSSIMIPTELIGAVIGPGGDMIRSICRETETEIEIEDDGKILIAATSKESSDAALRRIEAIIKQPDEGAVYTGRIKEVREGLGAFVEFMPGKTGLLHISQITREHLETIGDTLKVGEMIEVKLLEISRDGKFRLSRKALLPRLEGEEDRPERSDRRDSRRPPSGGGNRRDDDHRGPRRDDRRHDDRPPRHNR